MEFAAKQLEKYGWKQGQGLGKKKSGISSAIKVALKRDTAGVGYDASSEFTRQWWSAAFDEAISGVCVQDVEDGVIVESEGTQTASSTLKQGHCDHLPTLLYEHFTKATKSLEMEETALQHPSQAVGVEDSEELLRRRGSSPQSHRVGQVMSDEQLLKACGGRTAHKAARHGLKLSGKLKRIAQQDRVLAESLQLGKGEKGLSETLEREGPSSPRKRTRESRQAEIATQARRKAKKRKL